MENKNTIGWISLLQALFFLTIIVAGICTLIYDWPFPGVSRQELAEVCFAFAAGGVAFTAFRAFALDGGKQNTTVALPTGSILHPQSQRHASDSEPIRSYSPPLPLDREIDALEKKTRDYLHAVLSANAPDYSNLIPFDVLQSARLKISEHLKRHPYDKKLFLSNRRSLDYMDFMDYCKIILSNWNLFSEDFGSKAEVEKHFLNIKEVRNALKHGRDINSVARKQGEASVEWLGSIHRTAMRER